MKVKHVASGLTTINRIVVIEQDEDADEETVLADDLIGTWAIDSEGRVWKEHPTITAMFSGLMPDAGHPEDRKTRA